MAYQLLTSAILQGKSFLNLLEFALVHESLYLSQTCVRKFLLKLRVSCLGALNLSSCSQQVYRPRVCICQYVRARQWFAGLGFVNCSYASSCTLRELQDIPLGRGFPLCIYTRRVEESTGYQKIDQIWPRDENLKKCDALVVTAQFSHHTKILQTKPTTKTQEANWRRTKTWSRSPVGLPTPFYNFYSRRVLCKRLEIEPSKSTKSRVLFPCLQVCRSEGLQVCRLHVSHTAIHRGIKPGQLHFTNGNMLLLP